MTDWEFKNLRINRDGSFELMDLRRDQIETGKALDYRQALKSAFDGRVSGPRFSGHCVRESIMPIGGLAQPAGNVEYGFCQALHGEEFAVATFRALHGQANRPVVLGIIAGSPGSVPAPC